MQSLSDLNSQTISVREKEWEKEGTRLAIFCSSDILLLHSFPSPSLFFLVKGGLCLEHGVSYHIFQKSLPISEQQQKGKLTGDGQRV